MASYKSRSRSSMMRIWVQLLTVYMPCCISAVTSQGQPAFSVNVTVGSTQASYKFNDLMFERFYHCLRNTNFFCDIKTPNGGDVTNVNGCIQREFIASPSNEDVTCRTSVGGFVCKRGNYPEGTSENGCLLVYTVTVGVSLSQRVRMTWAGVNTVTVESKGHGITISTSGGKTYVISGTFIPAVETTTLTAGSPGTDMQKSDDSDDDDDDNNMPIIIGGAVGGIVIVSVIVIIAIVLWRRKKRPSSSSTANDKAYEDTDIYPYGDSNLNNTEPNRNPSNLNTNSTEPTPIMYSTVDPNIKLNRTQTSSDTNNANKLQPKKPRFNQNLDYTDVDIDNDADHYQSTPDVHDGQSVANRVTISPSAPPFPSAKPSSYSISSKTVENPSERYSQVVKTNKTKGASAINRDSTGSNPTRDPSGYEEARPHIDTQYATVDPSANNAPTSAPDGVYAKLHDPVRNITDVYNEWPATN